MRTTVTLEDDVMAEIRREVRRSGRSVKAVVNDALRFGLEPRPEATPFRVTPFDMQRLPGIEIDDIEGLLDLLDGPMRR